MKISTVKRQGLISFFWQVVFTLVGFLSTMYFAHTVGASVLGAYFLFLAYNGIFSLVADGGFGGAAVKRISEAEEPNEFFTAFFTIRTLFTSVVVALLLVFRRYFVDLNSSGIFEWVILALFVSLFEGSISSSIAGRGKMGIRTTCANISNILRIILQIIAIYLGYGEAGLAGGFIVGTLVGSLLEFHFFDMKLVKFNWEHVKSLSIFSFWLFLSAGGVLVFSYADTIIIGYLMSNYDVGIYRVALQFTMVATFISTPLRNTLWPMVSRWGKMRNSELVKISLAKALSYSLVLAVPAFIGGILLGDKLLYFFYGVDFVAGYPVLVVLLSVQIVNIFQNFFTMYLTALDYPKKSFKVTVSGVILNILLDFLLVPFIGILGAAIATFFTMTLNALLAKRELIRIINISYELDTFRNILYASVIMGLFLGIYRVFIHLSNVWISLVAVVLGGIVYVMSILLLDEKIHDEFQSIAIKVGFPWPDWL